MTFANRLMSRHGQFRNREYTAIANHPKRLKDKELLSLRSP